MAQGERLLKRFSRTTSSGNLIPEIDGLRCVAILAVIAFHLAGYVAEEARHPYWADPQTSWAYRIARTGHVGVQLFFVISGFVVALPFAQHRLAGGKKVDLRYYFLRRITRIEPPYVIALIFWLIVLGFAGGSTASLRDLVRHFPASLFYVHNLIYRSPSLVLPPAWSLEIEVQFYIVAPLLAMVFAIRRTRLRRGVLILGVAAMAAMQPLVREPGQINGFNLLHEAHYFLVGLLLVDFYLLSWRERGSKNWLIWDALAFAAAIGLVTLLLRNPVPSISSPALLGLICAGALRGRGLRAVLRNPWIYTLGGMCYSVYLYHGFFKAAPGHFTMNLRFGDSFAVNFLAQTAMLLPIIVVGSATMFLLTEKPFMRRDWPSRLARWLGAKRPARPVGPA